MAQPDLFGSARQPLLDDLTGRIDYIPDWIEPALAARWFDLLLRQVDWRAERRLMYEREVDVPRLLAAFELDDPALLEQLAQAGERLRRELAAPFNSVGLNLYRDHRDSVAPHNDRLKELVPGHPIALLSLGAARRISIRAKPPPRRVMHVDLAPGSLLTMSYLVQLHYDHGIPKQQQPLGARISLAYRVRPSTSR
jgi:alkylated DNA repair dioxygenase AlkB